MFVGRERELQSLERLYEKRGFQMAVVYGRRRVGKTALIGKFAEGKDAVFFIAQQRSSQQNLALFSREIQRHYSLPEEMGAFGSWDAAFRFLVGKARESDQRLLFVFDEFPYAAEMDPSLPSVLQSAIDHGFKETNAFIILCGSNEGFMEGKVLGRKSPLYGRRTAQIRLQPFDYYDAAKMLPASSLEDKVRYYATFGGTPYYLEQIDEGLSYEENVVEQFYGITGLLYEEPLMLLRRELREPALYNSILDAVGHGANKPKEIAEKAGVAVESMSKYLSTLEGLGIIAKKLPFGANPATSRKGIYVLRDPLFAYWYRFVSAYTGAIEVGGGEAVAASTAFGQALSTYVGTQFETMCLQWLVRQNNEGNLPLLATTFGSWWGPDPKNRRETDIDVVAANSHEKAIVVGECKWRNSFDESVVIAELERRSRLIPGYEDIYLVLFSKNRASAGTRKKAEAHGRLLLVSAGEMFA